MQNLVPSYDIWNKSSRCMELHCYRVRSRGQEELNRAHIQKYPISMVQQVNYQGNFWLKGFETHVIVVLHSRRTVPDFVPSDEKLENLRAELCKIFEIYDKILAKEKYIGGDTYTLADLYHTAKLHLLLKAGEEGLWEGKPNVKRWISEILNRESWLKITTPSPENIWWD